LDTAPLLSLSLGIGTLRRIYQESSKPKLEGCAATLVGVKPILIAFFRSN